MKYLIPEKQSIFLRASISNICNFSCQYCACDLGMENHTPANINAPLLTSDEYIHNMKLLAQHGFRNISFTGGEPLLNPEFEKIAEECKNIFHITEITTNGTRLIENIEAVRKYIDVLKISIDSLDPVLASEISGNSFSVCTPDIIEKCCIAGIKTIGLNFVYMKQNEKELPKIIDFASGLKQKYGTDIYISILDLYYSEGNRDFWQKQFINLDELRKRIAEENTKLNRRLRIGCDSYNFISNGITVNMKDSISCTHRAEICRNCSDYCQEGIYSLKHSASGWISVCPNNKPEYGSLINGKVSEQNIHDIIDRYVEILNSIRRYENTGEKFLGDRYEQNN